MIARLVRRLARAATGMKADERARWAKAETMADVGEATAEWLEGDLSAQPGYHGPTDTDEDLAPGMTATLAALNRAGVVTDSSQAGFDGPGHDSATWWQRASVRGFATTEAYERLDNAIAETDGLHLGRRRSSAWALRTDVPVTFRDGEVVTDFGSRTSARQVDDQYRACPRSARDEIKAAEQFVAWDDEPGRNDRLWPALDRAAKSDICTDEETDQA